MEGAAPRALLPTGSKDFSPHSKRPRSDALPWWSDRHEPRAGSDAPSPIKCSPNRAIKCASPPTETAIAPMTNKGLSESHSSLSPVFSMNVYIFPYLIAVIFALAHQGSFLLAALPVEEAAQLRYFVSATGITRDQEEQLDIALKRAADNGDYDIVEIAINNPNHFAHSSGIFFLERSDIPLATKRRILLSSLLNPSIWPPPERTDEELRHPSSSYRAAYWNIQALMCEALSAAFDAKIDPKAFGGFWSNEDRTKLAKTLGGSEIVAALASPDGARSIGPRTERGAGVDGKEDGIRNPVASIGKPSESASLPVGWALWAGFAAALAAATGWLLLRSKRKKG